MKVELSNLISSNTKMLEEFQAYLEFDRNLSKHTLRAYTADIEHFLFWLKDVNLSEVNTNTIRLYFSHTAGYIRAVAKLRARRLWDCVYPKQSSLNRFLLRKFLRKAFASS